MACLLALCLLVAHSARADLAPPLYVGNVVPAKDELGRPMKGSPLPANTASRPLVEIRTAANGVFPPGSNGVAHPLNPLLTAQSAGGMGLNAALENSGLFCMVFPDRPAAGTKVFVRTYNAPTAEEATFYADSAVVTVPVSEVSLVVTFKSAQPIDSGDDDGDGLSNAWEELLGIDDRATPDYDGDGMSDLNEMLAGTAPDDPGSKLGFRLIRREEGVAPAMAGEEPVRPVRVRWQSVPGKSYQLEYVLQLVPDAATGEPNLFIPVDGVVTAGEGEFEIEMIVDVPADALTGAFRVKLVTEE